MAGRGSPRSHIDSSEKVELPLCPSLEHTMRNGDGSLGGRRLIVSPARTSALWQRTCLKRSAVLEQAVPDLLRTACDGRKHASVVWMARVDVGVCEAGMMSSSRKHKRIQAGAWKSREGLHVSCRFPGSQQPALLTLYSPRHFDSLYSSIRAEHNFFFQRNC